MLDRARAKHGKPCPNGMAARARRILAGLGFALVVGCSASALQQTSKVLSGARLALEGLCEHVRSPHLDMALQLLDRGDLQGAAEYLRAELTQNGYQRDVGALLALIESQLPERPLHGANP